MYRMDACDDAGAHAPFSSLRADTTMARIRLQQTGSLGANDGNASERRLGVAASAVKPLTCMQKGRPECEMEGQSAAGVGQAGHK